MEAGAFERILFALGVVVLAVPPSFFTTSDNRERLLTLIGKSVR